MAGSRRFKPTKRCGLFLNLRKHRPIRIVDSESGAVMIITLDRQGRLNVDAPKRFVIEKDREPDAAIERHFHKRRTP